MILAKLGMNTRKIHARKCQVVDVNSRDEKTFMEMNHIQGYARSDVALGLVFEGELIAIMTFAKNRYRNKLANYELIRYANKIGCAVIGGASKLLSRYQFDSLISYANNRYSNGNLYKELGVSFHQRNNTRVLLFQKK